MNVERGTMSETNTTTSSVSSISTVPKEPVMLNNEVIGNQTQQQILQSKINMELSVKSWKGNNVPQYFLTDLLRFEKGKMDKKLEIHHISDAVVWNIVFLNQKCDLPTTSPNDTLRQQAMTWLMEFRKQMLCILKERIQQTYLRAANSSEWVSLRKKGNYFSTYGDLVEKTKNVTEAVVSNIFK